MKHIENITVIDIGSNTIRLLIGNLKDKKIKRIHSDRVVTRLGIDIQKNKKLSQKSIEKSIKILTKFKKIAHNFNSNIIIAVGTSALREAKNAIYFCNKIKEKCDIKIKIISGDEEAYFTMEGIKAGVNLIENNLFALDIGGGSTEWIYLMNNTLKKGSLHIGSLNSFKKFFYSDPPSSFEINNFYELIKEKIKIEIPLIHIPKIFTTGGTAVTLAMIALKLNDYNHKKIHLFKISFKKLKVFVDNISKISLIDRQKIVGLPHDRIDIILPGLIILESIAQYVGAKKIVISDYGFIEGIMKNYKIFCYN